MTLNLIVKFVLKATTILRMDDTALAQMDTMEVRMVFEKNVKVGEEHAMGL